MPETPEITETPETPALASSIPSAEGWYICKRPDGPCEIVSAEALASHSADAVQTWGPFAARDEAIARRVGLIRAGKCQPI